MKPKDIIFERLSFAKGDIILNEGEAGSTAYLIQSGSVRIFAEHNSKKVTLSTLYAGEIFGEGSLIRETPRSASAEANEDCNLIVITRQALQYKLERSDPTIRALVRMMAKRVQQGNDSLMNKKPTFEDLQDNMIYLYQELLGQLPSLNKPHFRQEVLPLIEELNKKMSEYKALTQ